MQMLPSRYVFQFPAELLNRTNGAHSAWEREHLTEVTLLPRTEAWNEFFNEGSHLRFEDDAWKNV